VGGARLNQHRLNPAASDLQHLTMRTSEEQLDANTRVRLKGDPTRHGILTGRTRPGRRGGGLRYQVTFPDTTSWIPDDQLEPVPVQQESPVDLLQARKFGRAVDLRRTLTHARLTGRLADVIYSMEATNTDFHPYQFKPVLRFLMSPSNALLIADEVGLGKTIEAGLVWTELKSRFDLRRLVVLCPAVLREKWKREFEHKIGVKADIVDAEGLLNLLQDPVAGTSGFAAICSLQGARPTRKWRDDPPANRPAKLALFLSSRAHDEPLIDLLVIDEAHYLRNPESQTHELGQLIRPVCESLLLLSATPIHNYNQDLFSLLQLLDSDTFERPDDLALILEASRPLVEARDHVLGPTPTSRRLVELLDSASQHPLLRGNRQLQLAREQAADQARLEDREFRAQFARRLETINPLAYVITRTRKRDVKEWRVLRNPVREQVPMKRCEKDFYDAVTRFVIDYAMSRAVNDRFILATPQRQMSSSMAATLRAWQQKRDNVDEVAAAGQEKSEADALGPLTREIIERAYDFGSVEELVKSDSKYARLRKMLKNFFAEHPTEKVVVFSTFRETLNYLCERLGEDGVTGIVLHGAVKPPKDEILDVFRDDPTIRVLLSSEVGSEGIDLQFSRVLVNYDLPWNPMRVEQRIGRLDRLGQQAESILIWNLFYGETIDSRIYERLYEKLDLCRKTLGDFEALLGDEVRKLTNDLLSGHLTDEQQRARIDQTALALANLEQEQHNLENEAAHLVAYGDYILNEVRAARELNRWIDGEDLRAYVTDFFHLHYPGCTFRQVKQERAEYDILLSNAAKQELEQIIRRERLTATWLTQNMSQPVRCRFENRTVVGTRYSGETISQFHPLVRFVSMSINNSQTQLRPAVALRLPASACGGGVTRGVHVLVVARWSVDGLQAVERLAFAAASLDAPGDGIATEDAERLASACARHGTDWFEAKTTVDIAVAVRIADEELFGELERAFREYVDDVRRQNEDRADLQLKNLERHLSNQRCQMLAVRDRHERLGRSSLVKATEGRIQALENRIAQRRLKIENNRAIRYRNDEVLVALVNVE
jgi:superfamily II DNA or RNA helicase